MIMVLKLWLSLGVWLVVITTIACQNLRFVPEQVSTQSSSVKNITTATASYATTNGSATTTAPGAASSWQGFVGAAVAIVFFGSNFIPVKKFETGDGMFFQWVFCIAIWIGGWVAYWVLNFPKFYALAMLGGFLWATGNVCVVPVIKTIGLGIGMLIWGSFNLIAGWASGRFGWFGLKPEIPNDTTLNYISIAFAMVSAVTWMFVKSQPNEAIRLDDDDDEPPLLSDDYRTPYEAMHDDDIPWENKLSTKKRRIIGVTLSIFSGILYGVAFAPVIHIKDNYPGASQRDVDYVFAHFTGILLTSTLYFAIYCMVKRNKPAVYPSVVLPAIVSGGMWATADIGWFVANNYLSEAVSFPIITTGPGIVASMWGVLLFKEVKGCRNYVVMLIAYGFTIAGAVLAGLSKA